MAKVAATPDTQPKGTVRFRPSRLDPSRGRYYLQVRRAGLPDEFIRCKAYTHVSDRPLVDAWAANEAIPALQQVEKEDAAKGESCGDWYGRYYDACGRGEVGRKNRGRPQVTAEKRRGLFERWIKPIIGAIPMRKVSTDDLRKIVSKLDEQIRIRAAYYADATDESPRKPGLAYATAANVWNEVTSGFDEASTSKLDTFRVRPNSNPAKDVRGPSTGDAREQAALYSSEVIDLLSCDEVPIRRRRLYALAIYSGCRQSELRGLTAEDVDLEHGVIRVRRQKKYGQESSRTKTRAGIREVPIEPALLPLLEELVARPMGVDGALIPVPRPDGRNGASDLLRKDLEAAGCTREELTADDDARMPFTFHGLRHTALTHWSVAGRPLPWLLAVAGHTDYATTQRYLERNAITRATFGAPHPPLPSDLVGTALVPLVPSTLETAGIYGEIEKPRRDHQNGSPRKDGQTDVSPGTDEGTRDAIQGDSRRVDTVETALAEALTRASAAGQWDVVAMLARELEARRLATMPNVVALPIAKRPASP